MKLGTLLVRDGRLTASQVESAVAQQGRVGARLGTVLVEMGLIDVDALTVYLGLMLGVPIATRAALDRAKRAAVRLLPAEVAERFLVVPLVVQDRQLIAAMRDPHDLLALDELAGVTGCRVIPRVAPEARLYIYLERYYGVPRPHRYARLDETIMGRGGGGFIEPPPPLPGLPPPTKTPLAWPPQPAPTLRPVIVDDEGPGADELAAALAADSAETADTAAPTAAETKAAETKAEAPRDESVQPIDAEGVAGGPGRALLGRGGGEGPEPPSAIDLDTAIDRMKQATARNEVADALVAYARSLFEVAVLFVVRDDLAFGWKGFGDKLDRDRIETLLVPLDAPSIFHAAAEAPAEIFVGEVPPSALSSHIYKVMRTTAPKQAVVAPIAIKDRVVNLLYAHNREGVVGEMGLEGLQLLVRGTSNAYVRLIALQKA